MTKIQSWLKAFRLRTLPLAFSSIIMGAFLAARDNAFSAPIFALTLLTTLFLQILSNLANDYGDYIKGTDNEARVGPSRTVQSGLISAEEMKKAIIICSSLAFISGISLLYLSGAFYNLKMLLFFLLLVIFCIAAAITYTVGKNAYGYKGFGDISVLIFFGFVGVLGTYFLMSQQFHPLYLFPAITCGFFATGVLNLNNLRDIENDKASGKKSIPVQIGFKSGKIYQNLLVISGIGCLLIFILLTYSSIIQFLPFLILPILFIHLKKVNSTMVPKDLDKFLKQLALLSVLTSILFGIGQIL